MKKNKLTITLTLILTICTSNLQAMTKTRTLAQAATTAAAYARKNKLKTTGMVIGGVIAFDALRAKCCRIYYTPKVKGAQQLHDQMFRAHDAAFEKKMLSNRRHWGEYPTEAQEKQHTENVAAHKIVEQQYKNAKAAYIRITQGANSSTLLYKVYRIISHTINKMRGL